MLLFFFLLFIPNITIFYFLYLFYYKRSLLFHEIISLTIPVSISLTCVVSLVVRHALKIPFSFLHHSIIISLFFLFFFSLYLYNYFATKNKHTKENNDKITEQEKEKENEKNKNKITLFGSIINEINKETEYKILLLVNGILFYVLYSKSLLFPENNGPHVLRNSYGDLPFHQTLIESFLSGCNSGDISYQDYSLPFYYKGKMAYPFFIDYYSALLTSSGASFRNGLLFPSVFLIMSLVSLLYSFGKRICSNRIGGFMTCFLVILSGGVGFIYFFKDPINNLTNFKFDYVYKIAPNLEYFWFGFVDATILPQRSALLGYPLLLGVLSIFWDFFKSFRGYPITFLKKKDSKILEKIDLFKLMALASLLTGLCPLSHIHSYASIAFLAPLLALFHFPFININKNKNKNKNNNTNLTNEDKNKNKNNTNQNIDEIETVNLNGNNQTKSKKIYFLCWLLFAILANVIAFPQLLSYLNRVEENPKFIQYHPVWKNKNVNPIKFIFRSLGPLLSIYLLSLPLPFKFFKGKSFYNRISHLFFSLPFLLLFILTCFIKFQPWYYDNIKFMNVSIFGFAAFGSKFIIWLAQLSDNFYIGNSVHQNTQTNKKNENYNKNRNAIVKKKNTNNNSVKLIIAILLTVISILIFLTCIASGLLSVIGLKDAYHKLNSPIDLHAGNFIRQYTPPNATFLSYANSHNIAYGSYAGRKSVAGYEGWLWSHGIDYFQTKKDIKKMIDPSPNYPMEIIRKLYQKYKVTHVWQYDFDAVKISNTIIQNIGLRLIYHNQHIKIYEYVNSI
ncbi:mobility group protein b3 [Anaeramoeba flamelloides]|uniref:Mobility group protein b3 n=1 Tax=Anaeramoeba flamelloides TaxID=1746091 RepID=A0ABQ8XIS1_9EUKA|nr:mobility group protein b3 [Anaeramoeba flamelloides]